MIAERVYSKLFVSAKDSPDGETPTMIWLTEEKSGYALFFCSHKTGTIFTRWFTNRNQAIEFAVLSKREDYEDV